jgi:LmbE family N-acetylglucosaminyl deacetylase
MMTSLVTAAASPLADPEALPLLPPTAVQEFGPTLVIAPHQDDETLGCGGTIALLRRAGVPVSVLFVSDGTGSHPRSTAYPPARLRATREAEALAALRVLGVAPEAIAFLRLPDTAVPQIGHPDFAEATARVEAFLDRATPATVLLPWRRDPHCDHRAAWQLVHAALAGQFSRQRLLEYPIWVWELAADGDLPLVDEVAGWRLDVRPVLALKAAAIAAHRSQTTDLIADDPEGFRLLPDVLAHFTRPWEIFLEERGGSVR